MTNFIGTGENLYNFEGKTMHLFKCRTTIEITRDEKLGGFF
jgi:hypothetical protein